MQAEQERLLASGGSVGHVFDGARRQQIGEIAILGDEPFPIV